MIIVKLLFQNTSVPVEEKFDNMEVALEYINSFLELEQWFDRIEIIDLSKKECDNH